MNKRQFLENLDSLTQSLGEKITNLDEEYQVARKSMFNKNKKKCVVYEDVIDTLTDYIETAQKLAQEYATCDVLIEDTDADRVYFSMPIQ